MSENEKTPESRYILDVQIGFLLRLASQRHAAIFQAHDSYGLTPTQFTALMRISEQGECSQNQLGRLAAMDVATIKGVVDRLRQKGLTVAKPDPGDRRRTLISLSEKGAGIVSDLRKAGHRISRETMRPLTDVEQHRLISLIQKIT